MSYESQIRRFQGKTKDEMIAIYNSKNCSPMWDTMEKRYALQAMQDLLDGKVENVLYVDPMEKIMQSKGKVVTKMKEKTDEEKLLEAIKSAPVKESGFVDTEEEDDAPAPAAPRKEPMLEDNHAKVEKTPAPPVKHRKTRTSVKK